METGIESAVREHLGLSGPVQRVVTFGSVLDDAVLARTQDKLHEIDALLVSTEFVGGTGFEANVWEVANVSESALAALVTELGATGTSSASTLAGTPFTAVHTTSPLSVAQAEGGGRKMLIMDVDSTMITQEVIELLAAHAGVQDQVRAVTEAAMRGELDFMQSLHERVRTLEGLPVSVIEDVVAALEPTQGLQELVDAFHLAGNVVCAVSGGFTQILEPLAQRFGLDAYLANTLEYRGDTLSGTVRNEVVDAQVKARMLGQWAEQFGVLTQNVIAVGDGANDILMLEASALGVAFNAKPALRRHAKVCLDLPTLEPIRTFAAL